MSTDRDVVMLSPDAAQRLSGRIQSVVDPIVVGSQTIGGAALGAGAGELAHRAVDRLRYGTPMKFMTSSPVGRAVGAGLGAGLGLAHGIKRVRESAKRDKSGAYERRTAQRAIRAAERQGYNPVVQDSWLKIDRPKVREILQQDARLARESGVKAPRPSEMFKRKEGMVPTIVSDLAFDILEKEAKAKALKQLIKKVVGEAPGGVNPLSPGSGIKGVVGRLKPM